MTRPKRLRGARKRRAAREARELRARRVWAASLSPPPPYVNAGHGPCRHTWKDSETVSLSSGSRDEIRVCTMCQGFVIGARASVGTTWSMRVGAANTRCPRMSSSRG